MLDLRLLGGFDASLNGPEMAAETLQFPSRRAHVFLAYLALNPGDHQREYLANLLWDDRDHEQALTNLRSLLAQLPKALKPYLNTSRQAVGLDAARVAVDALAFQHALAAELTPAACETALALYRGALLQGVHVSDSRGLDDWVRQTSEALQRKAVDAHTALAQHRLRRRDAAGALEHAHAALALDPLNEDLHALVMRAYARNAQLEKALAHFQQCAALFEAELGLSPSR